MAEVESKVWDDLQAMFEDMAQHVAKHGKTIYPADSPLERTYGFTDGTKLWRVQERQVRFLIEKEPSELKRNALKNAFATTAGRRALAESFSKIPRIGGPKNRFHRDDVI